MTEATTLPQLQAHIDRLERSNLVPISAEVREAWEATARAIEDVARLIRDVDEMAARFRAQDDGSEQAVVYIAQAAAMRARLLTMMRMINPDQAWFWTEEWQAGEREVDAQIAAGDVLHFDSGEEFIAYLDALIPDDAAV